MNLIPKQPLASSRSKPNVQGNPNQTETKAQTSALLQNELYLTLPQYLKPTQFYLILHNSLHVQIFGLQLYIFTFRLHGIKTLPLSQMFLG